MSPVLLRQVEHFPHRVAEPEVLEVHGGRVTDDELRVVNKRRGEREVPVRTGAIGLEARYFNPDANPELPLTSSSPPRSPRTSRLSIRTGGGVRLWSALPRLSSTFGLPSRFGRLRIPFPEEALDHPAKVCRVGPLGAMCGLIRPVQVSRVSDGGSLRSCLLAGRSARFS